MCDVFAKFTKNEQDIIIFFPVEKFAKNKMSLLSFV